MTLKALIMSLVLFTTCENNLVDEIEGYKAINGHKVHYKISGEGKPVLLLHGGYLDLEVWNDQITDLNTQGFKTIRYSELGHGKTIRHKSENTEGYRVIDEFVKEFSNEEKVSIVGLSWGGTLAVDYVLKYPEKVDKLILVSPGLKNWEWVQDSIAKKIFELRKEAIAKNDTVQTAELFYQNWVVGPKREKANIGNVLEGQIRETILNNIKNHWGKEWSSIPVFSSIEDLSRIDKTTLILLGDKDVSDIHSISKIYKTRIKDSRLVEIKDAGHLMNVEKTEIFNKVLIDFLLEN